MSQNETDFHEDLSMEYPSPSVESGKSLEKQRKGRSNDDIFAIFECSHDNGWRESRRWLVVVFQELEAAVV